MEAHLGVYFIPQIFVPPLDNVSSSYEKLRGMK